MKRIVAVGACYMDTILSVPHFVAEDEKLRASSLVRRRGGNGPNTVEVLQQLLDRTAAGAFQSSLLVVLPQRNSPAVQEIHRSLGPKVLTDLCVYRDGGDEPASSYIIRNLAKGSRTIINYNSLPEMTRGEFVERTHAPRHQPDSMPAAWYHFEGRIPDVTLECLRHLRTACPDVGISVELEKPGREGLQDLVPHADVVFYSKSWALRNGYDTAAACLRAQAPPARHGRLLCCTWGDEGASCLDLGTQTLHHETAFTDRLGSVVDTIGAGDTFVAGMLYAWIVRGNDWPVAKQLQFANELAGRKVAQEGFAGLAERMAAWL